MVLRENAPHLFGPEGCFPNYICFLVPEKEAKRENWKRARREERGQTGGLKANEIQITPLLSGVYSMAWNS